VDAIRCGTRIGVIEFRDSSAAMRAVFHQGLGVRQRKAASSAPSVRTGAIGKDRGQHGHAPGAMFLRAVGWWRIGELV
jgi:hypothetical protein